MPDQVEPETAPDDGAGEEVTSGEPEERAGDAVPTGEPDAAMVDDAAATAGEAPDGSTAGPHPDPLPATAGPVDADDLVAARVEAALATVQAGVDGIRTGVDALAVGLDSTLADLSATAREETVGAGFAGLQGSVDELVRLTRRADDHVAELHAENQRLRAGELAGVTLPLLRDLVRLHDEVEQLTSAATPDAADDLALVRSRLLDTLARWGLTAFAPEAGAPLDATRHNGVGAVASSDGEAGTIAAVRRVGFAHDDGRTFRAADVEVFRAPPPPTTTATED